MLSPIILFTYNRLELTKKTIKHLIMNTESNNSVIYIFSDAEKSFSEKHKVQEVRDYLKKVKGFKKINLIERKKNFGLAKNIIQGTTEIINIYGRGIVLEDDLLTSENFLSYMNQGLDYYKDRDDIFSLTGFSSDLTSLSKLNSDAYLSYRSNSWGWATWQNQWETIDWGVKDYKKFIKDRIKVRKFNRGGIDLSRMLKQYQEGRNNSWAIRWTYSMFKQNKYCIHPKYSKIQNIGFGNDATHCTGIDIYNTKLDDGNQKKFNFTDDIKPKKIIANEIKYKYSYRNKIIMKILNKFLIYENILKKLKKYFLK